MNRNAITLVCLLFLSTAGAATAGPIDRHFSGSWYNPDQSGHGLQIEVINRSRAVVTWYAFDTQGNPLWLIGIGDLRGETLEAELASYAGAAFPPAFDPEAVTASPWGDIQIELTACDTARLAWDPVDGDYQAGEMTLERLTWIDGAHCDQGWEQTIRWQPDRRALGFEPLFLDYPDGSEAFYELDSSHASLPKPWQARNAVRISGNNHSDDLMMVLMRPLDGLAANTRYELELEMQFATNVPSDCFGVGGSPGEGVYMRLGASTGQPDYVIDEHGYRRAALDLGQQSNAGEDALNVGNMANGEDDWRCIDPDRPWRLKRVSTAGQEFTVPSDETGRIWVYGLSDSAFEATSTWYLTEFVVRLAVAE